MYILHFVNACKYIYMPTLFDEECDLFSIPLLNGLIFRSTTCSWFGEEVFIRLSSDFFCSLPPLACTASVLLSVVAAEGKKINKTCSEVLVLQPYNKKKDCFWGSLDDGTGQLIAMGEWWGAIQDSSYWISSVLVNGQGGRTITENQHI